MLANGAAADVLFCGVLINLHLHLEHTAGLEKIAQIRDL
jgi:hypothetical protein